MNRYTQLVKSKLDNNPEMLEKIDELKQSNGNTKDLFKVMFSYIIMDLVNKDDELLEIPRDEIELVELFQEYV